MRILIIEDEKDIADGICGLLQKEGYQTDVIGDGQQGLDFILSGIYDLVLLDIMLPGLSGIDVMKRARQAGAGVPVIMLTARSMAEDKIQGLDSGADDYLTKPFDAGELLARIRARTRLPGEKADTGLNVGDLRLERETYMLYGRKKSVKLGNKEFQIMEYLMANPGQILSKSAIIVKVWGFDSDTDENSLEAYISFLRKKLRFLDARTSIVTTKGAGYSVEES